MHRDMDRKLNPALNDETVFLRGANEPVRVYTY